MKLIKRKTKEKSVGEVEEYFVASQWQLMGRKFKKHKLAIIGSLILLILYFCAIFCEFFAPYDIYKRYNNYIYCSPQRIHFFHEGRFYLRPFVYNRKMEVDPDTWRKTYVEDKTKRYPIYLLVRGDKYKLWALFEWDVHLFGVKEPGTLFLLGTDDLGRDLFSRILHAARISLSIGLVGVSLSFIVGSILGGVSGYFGGIADIAIQRIIEFLICIPTIPLWMALSAALPRDWSMVRRFFGITIILSIIGWCGLARVVRGKILEIREEDFVTATIISGGTSLNVIFRHLLPSFTSYLIVHLTLAIPTMILAETALSFLGLGMRAPAVSWGTLLQHAQHVQSIGHHPWLLFPALFVIITVLAFNLVGDGLRDAADPYK